METNAQGTRAEFDVEEAKKRPCGYLNSRHSSNIVFGGFVSSRLSIFLLFSRQSRQHGRNTTFWAIVRLSWRLGRLTLHFIQRGLKHIRSLPESRETLQVEKHMDNCEMGVGECMVTM